MFSWLKELWALDQTLVVGIGLVFLSVIIIGGLHLWEHLEEPKRRERIEKARIEALKFMINAVDKNDKQ